jgi:azobenzene reductase
MDIVVIAGSNRQDAVSSRVARRVEQEIQERGHRTFRFDLHSKPLPFFSADDWQQSHAGLTEFKQAVAQADAIVLATPEYHGSVSGVLKNALDHLGQDHFRGKAVLAVSAAGGALGVSSLQQLQAIVRALHGINAPEWISVGGGEASAWGSAPDGQPGAAVRQRIVRATDTFLELAAKVRPQVTA